MCWLLALLLLLTDFAWTQPVEGPWEIRISERAVKSPEVCVRGTNADVLFIENDSVWHARFSLESHQLISPSTAVFPLRGWNSQVLNDLIPVNDSTWACIVDENEGAYYPGHNDIHNLTTLLFGGDSHVLSLGLDSSTTHWYLPQQGEYRNEGYSLTSRRGEGLIAAWIRSAFNGFDVTLTSRIVVLDASFAEDFRGYGDIMSLWNPAGNRAVGRELATNAIGVLTGGNFEAYISLCIITATDEFPLCAAASNCAFQVAYDFGLTNSNNMRTLFCDDAWSCAFYSVSLSFDQDGFLICYGQNPIDLPSAPQATFWHPDFGFAVLCSLPNSLQLARVDTNGTPFLSTGTMFWRDSLHTFRDANVTISDVGLILSAWTDVASGDTAAKRIMLGSVGWETPLASQPPGFTPQPSSFALSVYPNPFNSELHIKYYLPLTNQIELAVYNVLGQKVALLVDGSQEAGAKHAVWSPKVGSGVYFVTLKTLGGMKTEKVLLTR